MRLLLLLLSCLAATVSADEKPPLPYQDWGRCPFEGCTYQAWTTKQEVLVRAEPSLTARELFRLPGGQQVEGLTGVVITEEAGQVEILKPIRIGYSTEGKGPLLNMKAGEKLYILGWLGEGAGLFWYKGKTYILDYDYARTEIKYGPPPKNQWWVKIRDKQGREGWVLDTKSFAHMDRFE
jgi:hypothetical protein